MDKSIIAISHKNVQEGFGGRETFPHVKKEANRELRTET